MSGLYGNATGGFGNPQTYILTDGNGKEITGVLVENVTVFDATTDDVRLGKTYAADEGVKVGTKDIPAYHTTTGVYYVPANSELKIVMTNGDGCDYTELQAMVMPYNSSVNDSNAVNRVAMKDKVYNVGEATAISTVTKDVASSSISFGLTNGEQPAVIRYFTYKEES